MKKFGAQSIVMALVAVLVASCMSKPPEGVAPAHPAATTVKMDFFHRPLPELPLPNDVATRYDVHSATGRRINASMLAPTRMEERVRELIDRLDGWGVFQPISIPFTGPLNVESILAGHRDADYDLSNDVIYLVNVDRDSKSFGEFIHLDIGNGNYPVVLEDRGGYWGNDPRGDTISLVFEETDEDLNDNGKLDEGEDTDADGVLDKPNYLPGADPDPDDLAARADALMTFYELETNTLIVRPMIPLEERSTHAVVVTRRLTDENGDPVGSPYPFINHHSQTEALEPLGEVMASVGVSLDEVAFAFTFTTQTIASGWKAVRDGLYGHGLQGHMGEEFPAKFDSLLPIINPEHETFAGAKNAFVLSMKDLYAPLALIAAEFLGADGSSLGGQKLLDAFHYVDYVVMGSFDSPQLFPREDANGDWLPWNFQSWPEDLDRVPVELRHEQVYFQLMVPRKDISVRSDDKPAPLVIVSHGYTGNRFEELTGIGSFLARHGIASIGIDCVSHGIGIDSDEYQLATQILSSFGLDPFVQAVIEHDRAYDLDSDGFPNSGGDFWTAYLFHTRDVVRQSALDYMQLIRIVRSFDGERKWDFDMDGDGEPDIAGDFDGDGKIDIGGNATISMTGGSLGGIMSAVVAGVEPNLDVSIPIAAGGGLTDVGLRSFQGGVREAVLLRVMGPLYLGTAGEMGEQPMRFHTVIPSVNDDAHVDIAEVEGVAEGDTVLALNLANGERGCGYVHASEEDETLRVRVGVGSDIGDPTAIEIYDGNALVLGSTTCEIVEGAEPKEVIDTFGFNATFEGEEFKAHSPLVALAEGLGLRRANPEMRRFLSLGQMVLDAADPAVMAPHIQLDPIEYPGTGEKTGAHLLLVTTAGDMNVPANTGLSIGRAAGLIDYLEDDPRYGKPPNQVLLDTFTAEAVHTLKRFVDSEGNGVHMDVENFSEGTDHWGTEIPRLDPPLRLGFDSEDYIGGKSAAIFPFPRPGGQHGFALPGGLIDEARDACKEGCPEDEDCGCADLLSFDIGSLMSNMMARYILSGGQELGVDMCMSRDDCDFIPPIPVFDE